MEFPVNKYRVEPGNVHHIHYVASVSIGNVTRTKANPPKDCTAEDIPGTYVTTDGIADCIQYGDKCVCPYATDLMGKVVLVPGFNCGIIKYANNNEFQFISRKGIGASVDEKQIEYPLCPDEEIPPNSYYYSGGIPCDSTIKAINGINEKLIPFIAGPGIKIDTEDNIIRLSIDTSALKGKCEDECGNTN